MKIEKEESKMSLFADNILYREDPEDSRKKLLQPINNFRIQS